MSIVPVTGRKSRQEPAPACAGTPLELFYEPENTSEALALCAECPVRTLCLREELRLPQNHQWGIRGGMTAHRRRTFLRDLRRAGYTLPSPRVRHEMATVVELTPTMPTVTSAVAA